MAAVVQTFTFYAFYRQQHSARISIASLDIPAFTLAPVVFVQSMGAPDADRRMQIAGIRVRSDICMNLRC